jgi:hypothetical protein
VILKGKHHPIREYHKGIANKYFITQPGQDSLTGIVTPDSNADTSSDLPVKYNKS